jgi:hypothetical protein
MSDHVMHSEPSVPRKVVTPAPVVIIDQREQTPLPFSQLATRELRKSASNLLESRQAKSAQLSKVGRLDELKAKSDGKTTNTNMQAR